MIISTYSSTQSKILEFLLGDFRKLWNKGDDLGDLYTITIPKRGCIEHSIASFKYSEKTIEICLLFYINAIIENNQPLFQ